MASDFDPRFDPAFQRGFDSPPPAPAPAPSRRTEPSPSRRVELVETSHPMRVEPAETLPTQLPTLRGNPFIPALWIVAAVFTASGVATQYITQVVNYSVTADTAAMEYVLPAVFTALSPWLFAAGLAAGIAALVIHALRWRPAD